MIDLTQGQWIPFCITVIVLTTAIFIRYLLMAGLFYYLFNIRYAAKFAPNRINTRVSKKGQIKSEILYALIASLLFGILHGNLVRQPFIMKYPTIIGVG